MAKASLELKMEVPPDYFDDLVAACNESPCPDVAKGFLNDEFGIRDRFGELFVIESGPASAGVMTLSLKKTDLYFELLAAIRTGEFDDLRGQQGVDVVHGEGPGGNG